MRNAAANFDDDFDLKAPARKKAPRRNASGNRKTKGKRRFSLDMKKVARYAAIGMSATVALGIMVNALVLQKSRHPAPLFGSTSITMLETNTSPEPKATVVPPMPVAKPVLAPEADPAISAPTDPEDAATAPDDDQIAQLLQGRPIKSDRPETKTVLGAQRALIKLGFAAKATGNFGPQTKKALELFEKDRHLPVNGELSRRVLKILAAESGLKIEH